MKDKLFELLYNLSKIPYQRFFKNKEPWTVNREILLTYPEQSLGHDLGLFLTVNHFSMEPKLEDHDVMHVLTGIGTSVKEEIAMQFYLFGNGKRSLYLLAVLFIGSLFYPLELFFFISYYKRGQKALSFYYLDYSKLLLHPTEKIRKTFKII
ncbi:ubiquinone biosynthesis protein COQ4 [Flavobacterium cerinum]|uniref:Ubiquinone biosynthesis protein COQ4 n=1 Tax=Flavobacterium cerinum TaxID=2502784 RepID=A0ABY5IS29_9FLAO|nr:ubiquinone biosynthesis protein COQ4 [Flavobacterium cerinum]UUC45080.1 ubiquinone biosynthesis protein COQ4 [Flavobacterium cerinum]